ncbi:MAG: ribonuclease P protein component [Christensenellales bacterium]|jgi:ribonuclease P protein component|nr:ribonuclease P protein component [Clostridiales bacterium]
MKKEYRLTGNRSFQYIYKNGQRVNTKFFILYIVEAATIKVGVSVSKKVGNSVVRSRAKRRLKEAFRTIIGNLKRGYNFVIVAKKEIVDAEFWEIKEEIKKALSSRCDYIAEKKDEVSL